MVFDGAIVRRAAQKVSDAQGKFINRIVFGVAGGIARDISTTVNGFSTQVVDRLKDNVMHQRMMTRGILMGYGIEPRLNPKTLFRKSIIR